MGSHNNSLGLIIFWHTINWIISQLTTSQTLGNMLNGAGDTRGMGNVSWYCAVLVRGAGEMQGKTAR